MTATAAVRERGITFGAPMVSAIQREVDPKWQTRRIMRINDPWQEAAPREKLLMRTEFQEPGIARFTTLDARRVLVVCCPYGKPGDRLYVREAWRTGKTLDPSSPKEIGDKCLEAGFKLPSAPVWYEADGQHRRWGDNDLGDFDGIGRYRNARFMPRWASRITLEITEVRVQQLQEISEVDARAEGCEETPITDADIREAIENPMDESKALMVALGPGIITAKADFAMLWDSIHGTEHPWASSPWVWVVSFRNISATQGE